MDKLEVNVNRRKKKLCEFTIVIAGKNEESEFQYEEDEGRARGYLDVLSIESFYETDDGCSIIMMETGDGFKVENTIEYILEQLNDV